MILHAIPTLIVRVLKLRVAMCTTMSVKCRYVLVLRGPCFEFLCTIQVMMFRTDRLYERYESFM